MTISIAALDVSVRYSTRFDRRSSWKIFGGRSTEDVVALDHVSFEIRQGEAWGIIGPNGAGKSTLLRVLGGTLKPDEGTVSVNGKLSALLSLGVGFNPALSGRRNVYLGALANGLSTRKINGRFDEIVEFAGLEDAIDRPLKTYSSGMVARLGFATGIHLDPEILLLDEVFSVGDEDFRERSFAAITQLLDSSSTVVFVSHQLANVVSLCDSALWLSDGAIRAAGSSDEIVASYRRAVSPEASALAGRLESDRRWTVNQKTELLLRLFSGESADLLSREFGVSNRVIQGWRTAFVQGGREALRPPVLGGK